MRRGAVVALYIAAEAGAPMSAVKRVNAVAGRGLEGDRYHAERGHYSYHPGPIREVSLIEAETFDALRRDHKLELAPGITRRNIVTRGVALNHLVGREFRVGAAILRGVKLCEPCQHLVDLTGIAPLLSTLIHRGGLHAQIVVGGLICTDDNVEDLHSY